MWLVQRQIWLELAGGAKGHGGAHEQPECVCKHDADEEDCHC